MLEFILKQKNNCCCRDAMGKAQVTHLHQTCSQIMVIVIDSSIESRTTRLVPHIHISASFNQKTRERGMEMSSPQKCRLCVPDGPHLSVYLRPSIEQHGQNVGTTCFTKRSKAAISPHIYIFTADVGVCSILQHQLHGFRITVMHCPYQWIRLYIWY